MTRNQTLHETLIPALAAQLGVRRYLELGTHQNETIGRVAVMLPPDSVVVGVDVTEPTHRARNVAYRIMSSTAYLAGPVAIDAPFDMVFIDADHSAQAVLADFYGVLPHVRPDGLILLHDGNPETVADTEPGYCGTGWQAIRTITETHEAVTLPYHPGLTIVRKRALWGPAPSPLPADRDSAERS